MCHESFRSPPSICLNKKHISFGKKGSHNTETVRGGEASKRCGGYSVLSRMLVVVLVILNKEIKMEESLLRNN